MFLTAEESQQLELILGSLPEFNKEATAKLQTMLLLRLGPRADLIGAIILHLRPLQRYTCGRVLCQRCKEGLPVLIHKESRATCDKCGLQGWLCSHIKQPKESWINAQHVCS